MTTNPPTKIRLSFDIDYGLWLRLSRSIPHGIRKYIYKSIIEGLAIQLERDRNGTLTKIIQCTWTVDEALEALREEENVRSQERV